MNKCSSDFDCSISGGVVESSSDEEEGEEISETMTSSDHNSSSSSSSHDDQSPVAGPLNDISSTLVIRQLPALNKRGLSMYYDGKSESFSCLSKVKCLEDLPKARADNVYRKKLKYSSSFLLNI